MDTGTPQPNPCPWQFDLKEKKSFFGQRKDYWDFLCQGLARRRQEHEGVRFVTSLDKVGTGHPRGGGAHGAPTRVCAPPLHARALAHSCSVPSPLISAPAAP